MNALDGLGIDTAIQAAEQKQGEQDKVGQNQFLEMLVAQLENQDPLNPQDSADFAAQLAQFSTVEQLIAMRTGIDKLVSTLEQQGAADGASAQLDPASLVGREVVVIGSQIEVDGEGSAIELPLRTRETAVRAEVKITDATGQVRYQSSILPVDDKGAAHALTPGDHSFRFDPAAHGLPEGVYTIEFTAEKANGDPVTVLPMVTGVVSGAVLAGDPAIRIGSRFFSLDDILEVRLAPAASPSDASGEATGTGGGQTVYRPAAGATPGATAS
ncbi:MAG: flagellar hook capping FlgD N-terminal domain-containing protein [Myxococcota bacterium]